jgi:signal peptidase I
MRRRTVILLAILALVGIGITILRVFFIRGVYVPTGSMANTIIPGDTLLITKSFGQIERDAIILFRYSPEYLRQEDRDHDPFGSRIGRVVGLPGETIQMRGRTVYINGHAVGEQKVLARDVEPRDSLQVISTQGSGPYRVFYTTRLNEDESALVNEVPFAGEEPFQIPKDSYFVMGDNRDNAEDSRYRGPVPRNLIWGNVALVFYSKTLTTDEFRWNRMFTKVH